MKNIKQGKIKIYIKVVSWFWFIWLVVHFWLSIWQVIEILWNLHRYMNWIKRFYSFSIPIKCSSVEWLMSLCDCDLWLFYVMITKIKGVHFVSLCNTFFYESFIPKKKKKKKKPDFMRRVLIKYRSSREFF